MGLGEVQQLILVGLALGRTWSALQLGRSLPFQLRILNLGSWNGDFLTSSNSVIGQLLLSVPRNELRDRSFLLHLPHQRRFIVNGIRIRIKGNSIGQKRKRLRLT
jgi:hypothetical protein